MPKNLIGGFPSQLTSVIKRQSFDWPIPRLWKNNVVGDSLLAAAEAALMMQFDRVSQAFHQRPLVEWLAQEADRSVIERTSPVFVVWVRGNQNYRDLISLQL